MFMSKAAIRAIEAKHAENRDAIARAQGTADKSLQKIEEHMKDCADGRVEAVKWRASTDATLKTQNAALDAIKSTSRTIFWFVASLVFTMFGGVIIALAVVVYDLIKRGGHP